MKWLLCKSDFLLILSDGQLFFFNPDLKTCKKPLKDVTNCSEFVLFESFNEELQLVLLCGKSVLLINIQPDQAFVPKQILSLNESPSGIAAAKSSILLQYPRDIERIILVNGNKPLQVDRVRTNSHGNLIYIEELEVFTFLLGNISYFLPEKGPFDVNSLKVKWSVPPKRLVVVDPYIIGLSDRGVEMHHYYKPHVITQFEENLSSVIVSVATTEYVGQTKEITDTMPGLFIIAQRGGKSVLCKFDQASLEEQCGWFAKASEYKLALNTCDAFIRRKYKKSVTAEEYIGIQRERGHHLFVVEKNYKKAKKIFEKYDVPAEEVILLFAELLHKANVEKLIEMFGIDYKSNVCYYCWYTVEDAVVPMGRMKELAKQLKVFLLFFMDKRKQLIDKVNAARKELISTTTGISFNKALEEKLEKLSFLKMLYEMAFFHGCLILIICKNPDASLVLQEFRAMLSEENSLPSTICEDLLIKYEVFPLLFQFLISKRLFSKVFAYLKEFYQNSRKPQDNYAGDIKQYWLAETIKNSQEVNLHIEEGEFLKNIQWLFDSGNTSTLLECLKTRSNTVLYSPNLINFLLEKGGVRTAIAYLEYLVYEAPTVPPSVPTVLANYYMHAIEERARVISNCKGEAELSLDEINNDTEIIAIRNKFATFLEKAKEYNLKEVLEDIPPYLLKEKGILLVRQGKFVEGFSELILEAQLPLLAIRIGEECYQDTKDRRVLTELIKTLFDSYRVGNCLRLAITLVERYFDILLSTEIIEIIPDELEVDKLLPSLERIIEREFSVKNMLKIQKNCQEYRLLEAKHRECKARDKYKKVEGHEPCKKCGEAIGDSNALFISFDGSISHYRCGV